jgi:hypothetical protein
MKDAIILNNMISAYYPKLPLNPLKGTFGVLLRSIQMFEQMV